jgi:hypothetical protein
MDALAVALPLAVFLLLYAAITGLSWLRRLVGETLKARRKGMVLNLVRRAGPPAAGGIILLLAGGVLGLSGQAAPAGVLIGGGLAYGFHRGLADLHRPNWRELALRAALTLAIGLFLLWQLGAL